MRYSAYLEIGPSEHTMGYVFALPGVFVLARSPEAALGALPASLAGEFERLGRLGRAWPHADEPVEIVEAERADVTSDVEHGVSSALFRYELRPTRDEDLALALDRLDLAYADMGELLASGSLERAAAEEIMNRAAETEWWLLSRLGTKLDLRLQGDARERLATVRAATSERLGNLLPGDRERHAVFAGEAWTTRKVLRRLVQAARSYSVELSRLASAARP